MAEGGPSTNLARQRGVRLTATALSELSLALEDRWRESGATVKLTRQTRADMLGVSLPTLDRILARKSVDRSSLVHAFASLGIRWDDTFCESLVLAAADDTNGVEDQPPLPLAHRRVHRWAKVALVATCVLVASVAIFNFSQRQKEAWTAEYDQALATATGFYAQGKYDAADAELAKAMVVAEEHATSRDLASALKLRGDISSARGRLAAASEYYRAAISYRRLRGRPMWPAVFEALGVVQTRLGEYGAARKNLDFALDAYTKAGDINGIAEVTRDFGCLYSAMNRPEDAMPWFSKSLQTLATTDAPDLVIDVRGERAMVLVDLGRLAEARKELEACLAHWSKSKHLRWIGLCEMRLSVVESKAGNSTAALALLSRARKKFVEVGDEARVAEVDAYLSSGIGGR